MHDYSWSEEQRDSWKWAVAGVIALIAAMAIFASSDQPGYRYTESGVWLGPYDEHGNPTFDE